MGLDWRDFWITRTTKTIMRGVLSRILHPKGSRGDIDSVTKLGAVNIHQAADIAVPHMFSNFFG